MSSQRTLPALLRSIVRKCEGFLSDVVATAAVFLHLSSEIGYDGVLQLSKAEDPILPAFGEESRGNCLPFDR